MSKLTMLVLVLGTLSCKSKKDKSHEADLSTLEDTSTRSNSTSNDDPPPPPAEDRADDGKEESGGTGAAMALDEGKMGKKDGDRAQGQYKMGYGRAADAPSPVTTPKTVAQVKKPEPKKPNGGASEEGEAATRAWFPETFLFEPLVVTDDQGAATVPVRVPDRLTTWRVLALGHTRTGAQGGAVASFLGTLPAYVDPVVPKTLIVGDEIKLPIQLVNTTASPIATTLSTSATNATVTGGAGPRTIPAQGNLVDYAQLKADHPGIAKLRVGIGATDAVERPIDVRPAGKLVATTRSGTLAAPRTLEIEGPAASDPLTDRVHLLAFPGALALLRSELGVSTYRQGVADDAYALLLAGRASGLLASLGDKPDPEALRTLSILTAQRAIRDARTLDETSASLLAEAALAHEQNPVLARLGERAAAFLAKKQKPDGTFGGGGWTLQRVLVTTAEATRAVAAAKDTSDQRQRAKAVAIRAQGAFERNLGMVTNGYTAAAILASGAVTGELAAKLKEKVLADIKDADDGSKYLDVPLPVGNAQPPAARPDGGIPSRVEATALAVLALQGDPKAPLADLGATLLGAYALESGWGDGRANLVCMRAVLELFKAPMPDSVKITLTLDGKPVVEGTITKDKVRDVLVLDAPAAGIAGKHEWKITAEPAVPGLGYALALQSWVPWPKEQPAGLELQILTSKEPTVGKAVDVALVAVAPAHRPLHITLGFPAGVQLDTPALEALVAAGTLKRFEAAEGKLELFANGLEPGQTFAAKLRVIPTLAGKLHAPASIIEMGGSSYVVPPAEWVIK